MLRQRLYAVKPVCRIIRDYSKHKKLFGPRVKSRVGTVAKHIRDSKLQLDGVSTDRENQFNRTQFSQPYLINQAAEANFKKARQFRQKSELSDSNWDKLSRMVQKNTFLQLVDRHLAEQQQTFNKLKDGRRPLTAIKIQSVGLQAVRHRQIPSDSSGPSSSFRRIGGNQVQRPPARKTVKPQRKVINLVECTTIKLSQWETINSAPFDDF